jgi:hypothetical protein
VHSARVAIFAIAVVPVLERLPPRAMRGLLAAVPIGGGRDLEPTAVAIERGLSARQRLLGGSCVVRALTRYYFLRRAGFAVELVFGIDPAGGRADAHCWVERGGIPYREPAELTRFIPMFRIG